MSISEILWLFFMISALQPILQQKMLQAARLRVFNRFERARKTRVISLVHRQETMSFLGFPIMRYIDVNDSEEVLRAIKLTDPDCPIDIIIHTPGGLGPFDVGEAFFGAPISAPGVTGALVQALDPADAAGPLATDACSPLTNPAAVAGKVALVDRGTCGFPVKVKNAQDAGALAVVVADNAPGTPPGFLGGFDPAVTIVSARVSQADGSALKAALGGGPVSVTLGLDLTLRAGLERATGLVLLNSPNPLAPGR